MTNPTDSNADSDTTAKRLEDVKTLKSTPAVVAAVSAALAGDSAATELLTGDEKVAALLAMMDNLGPEDLAKVTSALESHIESRSADETSVGA